MPDSNTTDVGHPIYFGATDRPHPTYSEPRDVRTVADLPVRLFLGDLDWDSFGRVIGSARGAHCYLAYAGASTIPTAAIRGRRRPCSKPTFGNRNILDGNPHIEAPQTP